MEWFFWLLLLWTFFEPTAFSSQPEFDNLLWLGHATTTFLDDSLHVAAFCTNQTSCNLEVLIIWDLDVVPTRILSLAITVELGSIALNALCILLSLWNVTSSISVPGQIAWVCRYKRVLILASLIDILHLEAVLSELARYAVLSSLVVYSRISWISLCLRCVKLTTWSVDSFLLLFWL